MNCWGTCPVCTATYGWDQGCPCCEPAHALHGIKGELEKAKADLVQLKLDYLALQLKHQTAMATLIALEWSYPMSVQGPQPTCPVCRQGKGYGVDCRHKHTKECELKKVLGDL